MVEDVFPPLSRMQREDGAVAGAGLKLGGHGAGFVAGDHGEGQGPEVLRRGVLDAGQACRAVLVAVQRIPAVDHSALQGHPVVDMPGGQSAPVSEGSGELIGVGFGIEEVVDRGHAFVADDRVKVSDLDGKGLVADFGIGLRHGQPVVLALRVPALRAVLAALDPVALRQEVVVAVHKVETAADAPVAARRRQRFSTIMYS